MTLESRLDMPTEETTLLREEEASVKKSAATKRMAGGIMCAFAALALVSSSTSERSIPTTMKEFMAGLPVWSFLGCLLLGTVRGILDDTFSQGPALLVYCYALPYAIMNKACDGAAGGWGAHIAQLAVSVGIVATVLDQLKCEGDGFLAKVTQQVRWFNIAAAGMLTVGTAKVVLDRIHQPGVGLVDMFESALPFLGWMTTSVLAVYCITFDTLGKRGAGQSCWLLVLYTAAELGAASTSGDDLSAKCLKYSCIVGAAWSVCNAISIEDFIEDVAVGAVLGAMFVVLGYKTLSEAELTMDAIMKNIVAFTFAAILGVHAICSILAALKIEAFGKVGSGTFLGIFALCFVVKHKELIAAQGESTKFAKYADTMAEYGPALALVVLVLSFVKLVIDSSGILKTLNILTAVAQLMMILGILLGS